MTNVLHHRGPDDSGYYINNNIGLGHRRLSIIDLDTGHQPISNEDNTIWLVFNGEIYNFHKLRKSLIEKGHIFKTNSDTEVIVHLYEDFGYKCVEYLRGMFAFAIYDLKDESLYIARDRLGQKPLFYSQKDNKFYFASEIKSILQVNSFTAEPNFKAIHHYLTFKYVPHPLTAFNNINKLPHASYLVYKDNKIHIHRYWNPNSNKSLIKDENEIIYNLRSILTDSVKMRMISDVPLGAFLSGGIDSSIIVALMSLNSSKSVKTFSVGFREKRFDESEYADIVSRYYHTEHHKFIVEPNVVEDLTKLVWHYNEPFSDTSMLPTYYISRETRKFVTVALSGDAGDENFAGYQRYTAFKIMSVLENLPKNIRKILSDSILKHIPVPKKQQTNYGKFYRMMILLQNSGLQNYMPMIEDFSMSFKENIYTDAFFEKYRKDDSIDFIEKYYSEYNSNDPLSSILYTDLNTYLPDDLMTKVDIASMAVSLESRSPFMDHKFVEFTNRIPSSLKLKGLNTKYILKKAFKDYLPDKILHRNKMGFSVPVSDWLRTDLKPMVKDLLLSSSHNRGIFKQDKIEQLVNLHLSKKEEHGYRLWTLMCLELWFRMFIDRTLKQ